MGIRVNQKYSKKVKAALTRNGYPSQNELALAVGLAPSTVTNFFGGKNIFIKNFQDICEKLGLDWQEIFDREIDSSDNIEPENSPQANPQPQAMQTPSVSIEYPEGSVALDSPFYIHRPPKEQDCYKQISKPGALIRIKAPEQMGKTSLLIRVLDQAEKQGDRTVKISLKQADTQCFTNLDKFLRWFCVTISHKLKLENRLNEYWEDDISCNMRCETYFEEYILPEIYQPLTLGLDEVDRLFAYPDIYGDFFGLLRYLHEEARRTSIWQKLRLVLVHSTEIYVPLDINRSPFNAGFPVDLPEFSLEQVLNLAQLHELNWSSDDVTQLISMIGGHPFLVRLALYHIARQDVTLAKFLQTAATESGIYYNHLSRLVSALSKQPELLAAMREVAKVSHPVQLIAEIKFKLQAMGLVKITNDGVIPSCELYREYFRNF
ncbi:AAA-like domain-containing protein [Scytonema hofmannii FACHB-248]|uniref:AAA-like domain-containing protein n=1 Tax=Scytonema hofmannii FACHB-248 TaxID=1842502 RepID=A0ABR8GTF1_9CYAN|nr:MULTISPECIES: AAA-like domain-containing protein [Nostocales]MBD2606769.1 AAA-like domain-containing protein [Scytonema hofmannii FACHB-248]